MKLLTRDQFREGVFARDGYKCVFCDQPAVDAHHILERRLWPDGGYYLENGASVCEEHHLACERTLISVEEVRHAAGITKIITPPHLYDDQCFDKWGNTILEDGRRAKGGLFNDESVQKALKEGNALELFTSYVKYPRTMHLPWSENIHDDDRVIISMDGFKGERIIITEKMDGENTSMYRDHIHARSIDSKGGEDRAWVKTLWSRISHEIPEGWRVCGENLWAEHSISYKGLGSFFHGFSIWTDVNRCVSWDDTLLYFDVLGIKPVKVLYDGSADILSDAKAMEKLKAELPWDTSEGYVVRVAREFSYREFQSVVAKFVRKGHVQTAKHWRAGRAFIPNKLE